MVLLSVFVQVTTLERITLKRERQKPKPNRKTLKRMMVNLLGLILDC